VGVLQAFERRLGGLVEGAFAKVFKGDVQPVEIAGALQREADDKKTVVGRDKVLVPNDYVVELGDHDFDRLAEWAKPLGDELAAMVREHAAERGYSFVGPVTVDFEQMSDLATGVFRVRSGVAADSAGELRTKLGSAPASSREAAGPGPADALPGRPRLTIATGGNAPQGSPAARGEDVTYFLSKPVTIIGRAEQADLTLTDPGVSRRHAEVRVDGDDVQIADLGSTNGIRLNGGLVPQTRLVDGDRVELGSTTLIFRRDRD